MFQFHFVPEEQALTLSNGFLIWHISAIILIIIKFCFNFILFRLNSISFPKLLFTKYFLISAYFCHNFHFHKVFLILILFRRNCISFRKFLFLLALVFLISAYFCNNFHFHNVSFQIHFVPSQFQIVLSTSNNIL